MAAPAPWKTACNPQRPTAAQAAARAKFRQSLKEAQGVRPSVSDLAVGFRISETAANALPPPIRVSVMNPENRGVKLVWKHPTEVINDTGPDGAVRFDGTVPSAWEGYAQVELPVKAGGKYLISCDTRAWHETAAGATDRPFVRVLGEAKNGEWSKELARGTAPNSAPNVTVHGEFSNTPVDGKAWIRLKYVFEGRPVEEWAAFSCSVYTVK